jgi:hypothetical protein
MNDELESIWKDAVVACFKVLSQHLPGWTEKNHEKPPVRIAGLRAEIWNRDLPNTKQECPVCPRRDGTSIALKLVNSNTQLMTVSVFVKTTAVPSRKI